jgi:hypothetical protein
MASIRAIPCRPKFFVASASTSPMATMRNIDAYCSVGELIRDGVIVVDHILELTRFLDDATLFACMNDLTIAAIWSW